MGNNLLLKENQSSYSAEILADLIIERQLEKIKSRRNFSSPENDTEEEKW